MKGLLLLGALALGAVLPLGTALPLTLADEVTELNDKARAALVAGRPADAVLFLEAALVRAPGDETLRKNLAFAHYQVGAGERDAQALDRAAAAFARAWATWDGEPAYGLHLASTRLRTFALDEALAAAEAVSARHPGHADAYLLAGDALALLDQLDEALEAYRVAAAGADTVVAGAAAAAMERTARQLAVEADYQTLRTGSFVVRAPPDGDHLLLLGTLERARSEVLNAFSATRREPALVVLYPPQAFREVTGAHEWVGGLFDRKIRLPSADPARDGAVIEAAFRHEFTHLLVSEWSPRCPTFLNEGLAQLMEFGPGQGTGRLLAHLAARGLDRAELPALAELPDSFIAQTDRAAVELGYLVSLAFVDHVREFHGLRAVASWTRLTDRLPLGEAYAEATGRSLEEEEALFRERLRTAR